METYIESNEAHLISDLSVKTADNDKNIKNCWSDKKGDVKKKNSIFKAAKLKAGGGRNDDKPLTPLDERILLLIGLFAAEGLDMAESESMPKVYVIPRVEENPASPTGGTVSNELNTQSYTTQSYTQEFNKADFVEYLLPDTLDCVVNIEECNHSASLTSVKNPLVKDPQAKDARVQSLKVCFTPASFNYKERKCPETD
ncbi:hypothetical protein AVEN_89427-1 [Araneus ventricosus]|uniref:Uncharacterized protein n=1 Tax=Araneus ventricosus TaxID=182803 RepID=A0A4Y2LV46_ARAVE|nr:hypothetical protein AVEN_89427-1 [Araneus ventricosus]